MTRKKELSANFVKDLDKSLGSRDYSSMLREVKYENLDGAVNVQGGSILHMFAYDGLYTFIRLLLAQGANPNVVDYLGRTPLHYASVGGNIDALKLILEVGVDIDALTIEGNTPLHYACIARKKAVVEVLLQETVDINHIDNFGLSALHYTILYRDLDIAKLLLQHGAKVSMLASNNYSVLHAAAAAEDVDLVNLILEHKDGVTLINVRDSKLGWKPLDFAILTNNTQIVDLLRNKEAISLPKILEYEKLKLVVENIQEVVCMPGFMGGYVKEAIVMPVVVTGAVAAIKSDYSVLAQLTLRSVFGGVTYLIYDNIVYPRLTELINQYCKSYSEKIVPLHEITSLLLAEHYISRHSEYKLVLGSDCTTSTILRVSFQDLGADWAICELIGKQLESGVES